jgi:hypothetical protein
MAKSRTSFPFDMSVKDYCQRIDNFASSPMTYTPGTYLHTSEVRDLLEPLVSTIFWYGIQPHHRSTLIEHLQRADWTLSDGNFVHRCGDLFPWISSLSTTERESIRESQFGKLAAVSYALLCDVHPDRRPSLAGRLTFWSGLEFENIKEPPSVLVELARHWNYGSILAEMDPSQARSASFLQSIWSQMANPSTALDASLCPQKLDIPSLSLNID